MPLITRLMLQNFKSFRNWTCASLMTVTFWSGTMSQEKLILLALDLAE